jgi:isopenicillin N synthase-like dioxygenase
MPKSVPASIERIPAIDFAGFSAADTARRQTTVSELRAALESCGFLYLQNHGVAQSLIDAVFVQSREFFSLSAEAKQRAKPKERGSTRGYEGVGVQSLDEASPGDLKEIFQCGSEPVRVRPNAWPDNLPEFRATLLAFLDAAKASCNRLMQAIALSLGLPEHYFEPFHDKTDSTLRLLHYPPLAGAPAPGQLRAGAHTDFGGMNLLFQDDEGGLEIQAPDRNWIAAPALPGTAIVNTGDLIARWTNGLFRSSPHRVVNPVGPAAGKERYSFVLFHSPNPDAVISCLEPCHSVDNPPKFAPTTAAEHLRARAEASRRHSY